jgi:regulator of protease activity HflC (stomatin/prohibitin superfamily)
MMRPSAAIPVVIFVFAALVGALAGSVLAAAIGAEAFIAPLVISLVIGTLLSASVRVVAQWQRLVVLRLGRFHRVASPGMRFVIPVVDATIGIEMRTQTVDIAAQQAITKDNVPVLVQGVIFFRVENAEAAALAVEQYRRAISRFSQASLRDAVGSLTLDELLSHPDRLEAEIARSVELQSAQWGLHVEAIKLEDIVVPEDLKKMMSRQASSEREKRATIIKAEGDRIAADALSAAADVMGRSPGAMQLRTLQSIDGLGPSASNTVVLALPLEIMEAFRAYAAKSTRS